MGKVNSLNHEKSELKSERSFWGRYVAPMLLFLLAAVLLFFNLGTKYLWQDEAATAVLGSRLMKFGKPLAYDGMNLITMDHFYGEDASTLGERTGDPKLVV